MASEKYKPKSQLSSVRKGWQLLSISTRGEKVKLLQELINWCAPGLALLEDGIFGRNTQAAVMLMQSRFKQKVDGCVGKQTLSALETSAKSNEPPKPAEKYTLDPALKGIRRLAWGAKGAQVKAFQKMLNIALPGLGLTEDGILGQVGITAVQYVRRKLGLPANNIVDSELVKAVEMIIKRNMAQVRISAGQAHAERVENFKVNWREPAVTVNDMSQIDSNKGLRFGGADMNRCVSACITAGLVYKGPRGMKEGLRKLHKTGRELREKIQKSDLRFDVKDYILFELNAYIEDIEELLRKAPDRWIQGDLQAIQQAMHTIIAVDQHAHTQAGIRRLNDDHIGAMLQGVSTETTVKFRDKIWGHLRPRFGRKPMDIVIAQTSASTGSTVGDRVEGLNADAHAVLGVDGNEKDLVYDPAPRVDGSAYSKGVDSITDADLVCKARDIDDQYAIRNGLSVFAKNTMKDGVIDGCEIDGILELTMRDSQLKAKPDKADLEAALIGMFIRAGADLNAAKDLAKKIARGAKGPLRVPPYNPDPLGLLSASGPEGAEIRNRLRRETEESVKANKANREKKYSVGDIKRDPAAFLRHMTQVDGDINTSEDQVSCQFTSLVAMQLSSDPQKLVEMAKVLQKNAKKEGYSELTEGKAKECMDRIASGRFSPEDISAFTRALKMAGTRIHNNDFDHSQQLGTFGDLQRMGVQFPKGKIMTFGGYTGSGRHVVSMGGDVGYDPYPYPGASGRSTIVRSETALKEHGRQMARRFGLDQDRHLEQMTEFNGDGTITVTRYFTDARSSGIDEELVYDPPKKATYRLNKEKGGWYCSNAPYPMPKLLRFKPA